MKESPNRQERHLQALDVIERRKRDGCPFILYLRDFLGGAREGIVKSHYYTPDSRFTIDNILMEQLSGIGIIFVQSAAEEELWCDQPGGTLGPVGPSLCLPESSWQAEVESLIELAEIVIVDAPILSGGTRFELECCAKEETVHRTVVILPPPNVLTGENSSAPPHDADLLVQRFPRVVWSDDLRDDVIGNFAIKDLVDRACVIRKSSKGRWDELGRRKAPGSAFPVTYKDVASQYIFTSTLRDTTRIPWHSDPWKDNWERTFWGFHRAVLTMHAMIELGLVCPEECVHDLLLCYRSMVNLLGEASVSEQGILTRGDFELCRHLSIAAIRFAESSDNPRDRLVCDEMLAEVSRRAEKIKSDRIPYRSLLKALYFAHSREVITI